MWGKDVRIKAHICVIRGVGMFVWIEIVLLFYFRPQHLKIFRSQNNSNMIIMNNSNNNTYFF